MSTRKFMSNVQFRVVQIPVLTMSYLLEGTLGIHGVAARSVDRRRRSTGNTGSAYASLGQRRRLDSVEEEVTVTVVGDVHGALGV